MPISDSPQVGKQHAVPQNVMDVEFKLIGDLTMRQFAYLLVCGILAYVSYSTIIGIFKWPFTIVFTLLGIALAFIPIQDRGMDEWVINFTTAMFMPTQRIWRKEPMLPQAFVYQNIDVVKQELITLAPTSSRRKLEKYLEYGIDDEERDPLDIPEAEYIAKVRQAFSTPSAMQPAPSGVAVAVDEPPEEVLVEEAPKEPSPKKPESTKEDKEPSKETPKEPVKSQDQKVKPHEKSGVAPTKETSHKKPQDQKAGVPEKSKEESRKPVSQKKDQPNKGDAFTAAKKAAAPTPTPAPKPKKRKLPEQKKEIKFPSESAAKPAPMDLITPDRHAGRRFTQLLPSEGDIVLPIRGERILKTTAEQKIEEDIKEKADKLQMLLSQIRKDGPGTPALPGQSDTGAKKLPTQVTPAKPVSAPPSADTPKAAPTPKKEPPAADSPERKKLATETKIAVDKLKRENEKLTAEIQKLRTDISSSKKQSIETSGKEKLLHELEAQQNRAESDYAALHKQISELQNKLRQKSSVSPTDSSQGIKEYKVSSKTLTQKPNVVTGMLKDPSGNVLEGVLLIVKDHKGDPVRAFKTNTLGEFILTTPLENGMYTLEVSSVNEIPYSFDIISIEAKGEPIPPVEILGS
jgi:hypothetical protein